MAAAVSLRAQARVTERGLQAGAPSRWPRRSAPPSPAGRAPSSTPCRRAAGSPACRGSRPGASAFASAAEALGPGIAPHRRRGVRPARGSAGHLARERERGGGSAPSRPGPANPAPQRARPAAAARPPSRAGPRAPGGAVGSGGLSSAGESHSKEGPDHPSVRTLSPGSRPRAWREVRPGGPQSGPPPQQPAAAGRPGPSAKTPRPGRGAIRTTARRRMWVKRKKAPGGSHPKEASREPPGGVAAHELSDDRVG